MIHAVLYRGKQEIDRVKIDRSRRGFVLNETGEMVSLGEFFSKKHNLDFKTSVLGTEYWIDEISDYDETIKYSDDIDRRITEQRRIVLAVETYYAETIVHSEFSSIDEKNIIRAMMEEERDRLRALEEVKNDHNFKITWSA